MKQSALVAYFVVFLASFCTLVIELVAGRILAPYLGVSLYTWTSIIGVVLAGISVGALLGGYLADAYPRPATLGWLLLFSGLASLTIPGITDLIGRNWLAGQMSLMMRILVTTTVIFLAPALILGMISPVVVKLAVVDLDKSGGVVGKIYAFSTLGSIVGTFATGFYLIEAFGTRTILYMVSVALIIAAPLAGGLFAGRLVPRTALVSAVLFLGGLSLGLLFWNRDAVAHPRQFLIRDRDDVYFRIPPRSALDETTSFFKESEYYTIKIYDEDKGDDDQPRKVKTLVLDNLIHSHTDLDDKLYLQYPYLRIYEEFIAWRNRPESRTLFLGGGGFTLPRFLVAKYPKAHIDVAEIDPWVIAVAKGLLDADHQRIHATAGDARWYVMNCKEKYDFVIGDAFNDVSVPYHLTTKEFDLMVKGLLKPGGLYMALIIDNVSKGLFLPSYIKTMQAAFGEDNVHLVTLSGKPIDIMGHETVIVVAGEQRVDIEDFKKFLAQRQKDDITTNSIVVPDAELKNYMKTRTREVGFPYLSSQRVPWEPVLLTDDYAPVDNLTAPMFEERGGYKKRESVDDD